MYSNNAFSYLSNLPGAKPIKAYRADKQQGSPQAEVQRFENQTLGGLMSGTSATIGQQHAGPRFQDPAPSIKAVQQVVQGTSKAVRANSQQLLQNAQLQRAARVRRAQEEAQRRQQAQQSMTRVGGRVFPQGGGGGSYTGGPTRVTSGKMASRVQSMLPRFPGLRITETLGNRAYDVAHGVARWSGSYHYDRNNPAVDIAGPQNQLWALYYELKRQGGYRQILWQVAGHYDHLHVA